MEGLYIEEQDKRDLELERYNLALERILEIPNESISPEPFRTFFHKMADFVGQMDQTWRLVNCVSYPSLSCRSTILHYMRIFCRSIMRKAMAIRIMRLIAWESQWDRCFLSCTVNCVL